MLAWLTHFGTVLVQTIFDVLPIAAVIARSDLDVCGDFAIGHYTHEKNPVTARAALTTGADPHALVTALAQTELAVETAVTVRDKVVEAYQEILRMPV